MYSFGQRERDVRQSLLENRDHKTGNRRHSGTPVSFKPQRWDSSNPNARQKINNNNNNKTCVMKRLFFEPHYKIKGIVKHFKKCQSMFTCIKHVTHMRPRDCLVLILSPVILLLKMKIFFTTTVKCY